MRSAIRLLAASGAVCLALTATTGTSYSSQRGTRVHPTERPVSISQEYGNLPMSFEPNRGQFDPDFQFGSRGLNSSLLVNPTGLTVKFRSATLNMKLRGANTHAPVRGDSPLPGIANYFRGASENWVAKVPTYEQVVVENVYPGIDILYYGNQNRLEYDFVVAPNASAKTIDLEFAGSENIAINADGDLLINVAGEPIRQTKPTVYQEIDGQRTSVDGQYVIRSGNRVGFRIGGYDHSRSLIIDPQLVYSIYGQTMTRLYGIAVDAAGNAYVCGTTWSRGPNDQATEAYVAKLNSSGTAFLWSTWIGSYDYEDSASAIAIDAAGNAYVTGWTVYDVSGRQSPPFPTTPNAIQTKPGDFTDAFVSKFDTNGNLVYSTLLGGNQDERGEGIAVDALGNMFVTGQTSSANFPVANAMQSSIRGGSDAFISVLNAQGNAFIYSTYLGGSRVDGGSAIAVDSTGSAYVTGFTSSADFPVSDPVRMPEAGGQDAFVSKINPAGTGMVYSRYIGGSGDDYPTGIALDASNNAYISGRTNSTNFPTASPFQATLHGGWDAFVTKLDSSAAFVYSTYLGGGSDERTAGVWCEEKPNCGGIAVNTAGNAYVTGVTASPDFPQVRSLQGFKGTSDAFVTEFSVDGRSLVYSTLIGGSTSVQGGNAFSSGSSIAYSNGSAYVAGLTENSDFPVTSNPTGGPCCVNSVWNGIDGFIARLGDDPPAATWARVEQNNSAVQYAGNWYSNSSASHSGGTASLSLAGSATFSFSGTGARWIGFSDPWSGIANVYVDGVLKTSVDTYSAATKYQVVQYTITGLSSGNHTLKIAATGQRNSAASAAWIWVDAFESASDGGGGGGTPDFTLSVTPSSATVVQGGSATYTVSVTPSDGFSGAVSLGAGGLGSGAGASFNPPSINGSGSSTLTVTTTAATQTGAFTLTVTGSSGALSHSANATFNVNASGGTPTWTRVEQNATAAKYDGSWYSNANPNNSAGAAYLTLSGTVMFTFSGSGVRWIGFSDPWSGTANLYIDDRYQNTIDTYSASTKYQALQYSVTGLPSGTHTLMIVPTGQHNPAASSSWIWVDAFETTDAPVLGKDFMLLVTPQSSTASQGSSTSYQVSVAPVNKFGYEGTVRLSVTGLGSGAAGTFNPSSITDTGSSILTVTTTTAAQTGTFSFTITGSDGITTHQIPASLTVLTSSNGTWTRTEQTSTAVQYTGSWYSNTNANHSNGSAALALSGTVTFSFSGTGARWIGFSDAWAGIADVYVDGVLKASIDTYSAGTKYQAVQYAITGLSPGDHTVKIVATGRRNSAAAAAWIWVDAFESTN
jgi:hypothetical protein